MTSGMEIVKRIREMMKNKGLKQLDLIEYLGDSQSAVAKWISLNEKTRNDIPTHKLIKIAELLNTDINILCGAKKREISNFVPLIGKASCGKPQEYDLNGYDPIPIDNSLYREGMYAVEAEGDSMQPKINEGDIVYCCPSNICEIHNNNIVHYSIDGDSGIKKYKINEAGTIISLIPINPEHEIITIDYHDNVDLRMSKVVGSVDMDY